jgi:flagellar P-ring protein precursor FlgI
MICRSFICLLVLVPLGAAPGGTRLKDLVSIEGVRDNQLVGYGLVVGLNGTGDKTQTVFSPQSLTNLLARMGIQVNPTAILVKNTAAVLVTADLPPFAQPGTRIDISVAAIGDSTNLRGGVLVLTTMKGPDGQVYAAAQGSVVTGGFVAGRGGTNQTVNHPTAGRIPNGAIVEKLAPSVEPGGRIKLQLRQADYTTAARISDAINKRFGSVGSEPARAENSALVAVDTPAVYKSNVVEFLGEIENLTVEADRPAKIVSTNGPALS